MRPVLSCVAFLAATSTAPAATVFDSPTFNDNATTRGAWLTAIGEVEADFIERFAEADFTDGQAVSGSLGGGLTTTGGEIECGALSVGGSNPLGACALEMLQSGGISFSFAGGVDYFGFYIIDAPTPQFTVHFAGGGSQEVASDSTFSGGNTAEFFGVAREAGEGRIAAFDVAVPGSGKFAVDSLQWGESPPPAVPLPAPAALLAVALAGLAGLRRRRG